MNTGFKRILILILAIGLAFTCMTGCSDDDDNLIQVCNEDDEEYDVCLHRYDDDTVISEFDLGEPYDVFEDSCDEFENIATGMYYITIQADGSSDYTDISKKFYMDDDTKRYYWIDSTGSLDTDDDEGSISVCNNDDEEYLVELRRDDDGTVEDDFYLEEWSDFGDRCDSFDDVDDGSYYVIIYEDDSSTASSTSETFYIDSGMYKSFKIDSTGDLEED